MLHESINKDVNLAHVFLWIEEQCMCTGAQTKNNLVYCLFDTL